MKLADMIDLESIPFWVRVQTPLLIKYVNFLKLNVLLW